MNLGIDLGTSRVVICSPGDHAENGIVLDEPAVIAVDQRDGHLVACGEEAEKMLGRTPASIRAVRPLQNGVIAEYELAEMMLRHFLHRVCSNRVTKPCVAVSIAQKVTEVEQRSFIEAVVSAGARRVTLVPETVAAAIGAGLDVSRPRGQMLVNVGGGTTDAAVLSLRGTAVSASLRVAGTAMDEAIVRYVRAQYGLLIGEPMAERVKIAIGGVQRRDQPVSMTVKGRDALSGLPHAVEIHSDEICDVLQETTRLILAQIQQVLEMTPPELAGDIMQDCIWLTGGLAPLYGLRERIEQETGVPCRIPEHPAHCVAIGAARALQYASSFSEVYDLGDFSYHLSDSVTN